VYGEGSTTGADQVVQPPGRLGRRLPQSGREIDTHSAPDAAVKDLAELDRPAQHLFEA
jgi:hypothetical protein